MLHPDEIRRLCLRKYPAFLRAIIMEKGFFPLEIPFGQPSTTDEWEKLRRDIRTLAQDDIGYRIEWSEINTRRWGKQKLPRRVWFENEAEFLRAIHKEKEIDVFRCNVKLTRQMCPMLESWLLANTLRLVEFADSWLGLLKMCQYFLAHPFPKVYAREIQVEVGTKFVERHETILRGLLDHILPESAKVNAERFEERFGLRFDEPLIRFRLLDNSLRDRLHLSVDDLAVPLSQFRSQNWSHLTVVITENKMRTTFLTLPSIPNGLGIWGGGGAAELLKSVDWLSTCQIFYWGDIDVHGFHILSSLRRAFPMIKSVMMDESTLEQFRNYAVKAMPARYQDIGGLTKEEGQIYQTVNTEAVLLEQEKIPHSHASQMLSQALRYPG